MKTASPAVPLFVAASLGALAGLGREWPLVPLLAGVALAFLGALLARGAPARATLVLVLAASLAMTGSALERARSSRRAAALPNTVAVFEGVVDDVWFGKKGAVVALAVSGALVDGAPQPLSARLAVHLPEGMEPPAPGARVRVRGRAAPLLPSLAPGAFDDAALGLARGIDARLHVHAAHDLAALDGEHAWRPFAEARLALRERLVAQLTPREAGLVLALLVGDTSLIDDEQRAIYRAAGAGHLLAVSGLQVTLLAVLLARLVRSLVLLTPYGRLGRGRAFAGVVALAGVWGFVLLCGAPPSAVRAGAMGSAVLVAGLLGRRASVLDALGVAGLFSVLLSPAAVIDPSFLLSYAAVIGLVAASSRRSSSAGDTPPTLLARLRDAALTAVGAGVVTVPVSAFLFGQLAPAGLIANIVLVPAASILQVPALVGGALGAALDWHALSFIGAQAALLLEALTAGLADLLPGMRLVEAPTGFAALTLFSLAVGAVVAVARRAWLPATAVAAIALGVVGAGDLEAEGMRITVLPVGQGDSAVLELPNGTVLLIDGGPGDDDQGAAARVVLPFLARRGIDRIDVMVLSHPHPDHGAGLAAVARALPVGELWLTEASSEGDGVEDGIVQRLLAALPPGTRVRTTPELLGTHRFGVTTVEVQAPAPAERTATYPELSANDNSLVLRACFAASCALWPGDIEALGEEQLLTSGVDVRAAVVKAPHHGSSTSSIAAFVERVGARHVVFCTGPGNQFGFPAAAVLDRWRAAGARLWDTAVNGQITIVLGQDGVRMRAFREGQVVPGTGSARR
ncbi:MAG: DNA internalization-related competence protein ComEC/Rec2 [Deltaproteobacteria bacterium]|nr:DNA internalization-related competence protein ComEC/Rec2 [Deltaproteobacteria bacterium]